MMLLHVPPGEHSRLATVACAIPVVVPVILQRYSYGILLWSVKHDVLVEGHVLDESIRRKVVTVSFVPLETLRSMTNETK